MGSAERKIAQAARRKVKVSYRTLFNSMYELPFKERVKAATRIILKMKIQKGAK